MPATGAETKGEVIGISDGDTLTVLIAQKPTRIRIAEIDAPENGQAFGAKSKQSLADLCHRQPAEVKKVSLDRYGRTVARVSCAGSDAATHQITTGMAWVYDRYSSPESPLYAIQTEARLLRRGIWADSTPVEPWVYRRLKRRPNLP